MSNKNAAKQAPSSSTVEEEYDQGDEPLPAAPEAPKVIPKFEPPKDGLKRIPIEFARFTKQINFAGESLGHTPCAKNQVPAEVGTSYVGYVVPELHSLQVFQFRSGLVQMSRLVPFTMIDEYALA